MLAGRAMGAGCGCVSWLWAVKGSPAGRPRAARPWALCSVSAGSHWRDSPLPRPQARGSGGERGIRQTIHLQHEASGRQYTCSTRHQADNTPAERGIRQTIHLQHEASGRQYTCSTRHQADNTPAARGIRQTIHLQHEAIRQTIHLQQVTRENVRPSALQRVVLCSGSDTCGVQVGVEGVSKDCQRLTVCPQQPG